MSTQIATPTQDEIRSALLAYSDKYGYEVDYMLHILHDHPEAFAAFNAVIPLANCRQEAPLDVFFVAKLAGFQQSDCGACLQLSIRLALEAGVSRAIVEGVIKGSPTLPPELEEVRRFVRSLDDYSAETNALRESIRQRYGERTLIEIALVVTAAQLFPRVKRALGYFESCQLMDFSFEP